MIFSFYLLTILYTNTMGLIIISKCKPFINHEIETKGYKIKEKEDSDYVFNLLKKGIMFLIPGYYLKKAINLTCKDFNIYRVIDEKIKLGEIETNTMDMPIVDSIFKTDIGTLNLSKGKYEIYNSYKSRNINNSMYTDDRYSNTDEVDMDFWEEEVEEISCLETKVEKEVIKKEPIQEYIESISEEELIDMANQIDNIRKLKKANENLLNNSKAV